MSEGPTRVSPLRLVLDTALDPVIVMGRDGTVRDWSAQAEETFGWVREEALGRSMAELIIPEDFREAHAQGLGRYLETGAAAILGRRIEVTATDRSGRIFPVELSVLATEDAGETVFVGLVRDITARRRAEAIRLHHETQFRLLVDALPVLVSLIDREERFQLVNRTYEEWFQRPRHEILGKTVREMIGGDAYETRRLQLKAALAGEAVRFETFMPGPDGSVRLIEMIYEPRRDHDGRVEGVYVVGIDITESRQAQDALRAERDRARNVLEHMADGFALLDHEFRVLQINPTGLRLDRRPAEAILGKTHWEAWPGTEDSELGRLYKRAMRDQVAITFEHRYQWPNSERWAWLEVSIEPTPEGLALFYRDVTGRKTSEEVLRASEGRFRTLANVLPALVWMSSADGQVQFLNDRWFDYAGGQREAESMEDPALRLHPVDQAPAADLWAEAMEHGRGFESELRIQGRDGGYRWFLSRAEPVMDASGTVTGWIGASVDIDDRRKDEERLRLMLNELNHRVKNNLATVQALAAQTFRGTESLPHAREAFTTRLMALARMHDVLTRQQWEGTQLFEVAKGVLTQIFAEEGRFRAAGPPVSLSPNVALALSMALHELCTNAMKYGSLSTLAGQVELNWDIDGGGVVHLVWAESGGPPVSAPARSGFGTRLLQRSLAAELGGQVDLDYRPEGLVCTITARLSLLVGVHDLTPNSAA